MEKRTVGKNAALTLQGFPFATVKLPHFFPQASVELPGETDTRPKMTTDPDNWGLFCCRKSKVYCLGGAVVVCGVAVWVGAGADGTLEAAGAGIPDLVLYAWITAAVMSVPLLAQRTVGAACWLGVSSSTTVKPFCSA